MWLLYWIIQIVWVTVLTVIVVGITYVVIKKVQEMRAWLKSKKESFIFELLMKERMRKGQKDGEGSSDEEIRQKEMRKLRQKFN